MIHGSTSLESENLSSWDVLKAGVEKAENLDLLLAMHTRSLERRMGTSPAEKATLFFQYSIMNKLLANFCTALTKNKELVNRFYFPGCVLSSAEHTSMFLLQLTTLESLNFSAIWSSGEATRLDDETVPQRTVVLQSAPASAPSSAKVIAPPSYDKPIFEQPKPVAEPRDAASTLFGGFDASAPLTFSLKPKAAPTPSFSHAFVPMGSTTATHSATPSTAPPSSDSFVFQPRRTSTPPPQEEPVRAPVAASPPMNRSQTITPPPVDPPRRASQSLPPSSSPAPGRPTTPTPEHMSLAAELEAPALTVAPVPGSAKKRAKKRTVDL